MAFRGASGYKMFRKITIVSFGEIKINTTFVMHSKRM